jgi:hypothetical protein
MLSAPSKGPVLVPPGPFRRYATRYEPSRRDACLAWWELAPELEHGPCRADGAEEPASRQEFALLLDISHMGASVALDLAPVEGHGVWLRLEGDCLTEWSEAEVVGVTTTSRGPHLVRLAFRAPCPFETLKAAVCG